jgi:CHAD domain-containing protein
VLLHAEAADPREVEALHDMRIAAKRLRYILEITEPCFGEYARRR